MISQKELVPKRRFKGYLDKWEKLIFEDATSKIGDGLHGTPKYKKDGKVFFINGNNLVNGKIVINEETKRVAEEEQSKDDKTLCKSTILMSINGTIGNLAWYHGEELMLGKSVAYMQIKDQNKRFIYSFLQTNKVYKYFINSLTGSTIKNLGLKAIRENTLFAPHIEEQQKIGQFFKHLDEMITLEERKIDKTKALKSAYLAEMFPAEGEHIPIRRFKEYRDDQGWQEHYFEEDIVSIQTGTNLLGTENNKGTPLIKMGNVQRGYFSFDKLEYLVDNESVSDSDIINVGDFLFNTRNTLELVGKGATWFYESDKYAFNNNIARFTFRNINTTFFNYLYNTQKLIKQISARAVGSTSVAAVYPRDLNTVKYKIPSFSEQEKIGSFLKKIDDTILNHEQKLAKLKATKQAYLHEMFV